MKIMKSFRIDEELYEQLRIKSKQENRSITNLIETILWGWVRSH